ncbi:hypothetical protein CFP56_020474 [Quercus suber]|uniref:Uncharacterized protein n=1 Tax=Quercus suber TaxID=58331 RepID=A0AAW0M1A5_QUESU
MTGAGIFFVLHYSAHILSMPRLVEHPSTTHLDDARASPSASSGSSVSSYSSNYCHHKFSII